MLFRLKSIFSSFFIWKGRNFGAKPAWFSPEQATQHPCSLCTGSVILAWFQLVSPPLCRISRTCSFQTSLQIPQGTCLSLWASNYIKNVAWSDLPGARNWDADAAQQISAFCGFWAMCREAQCSLPALVCPRIVSFPQKNTSCKPQVAAATVILKQPSAISPNAKHTRHSRALYCWGFFWRLLQIQCPRTMDKLQPREFNSAPTPYGSEPMSVGCSYNKRLYYSLSSTWQILNLENWFVQQRLLLRVAC